MRALSVATLCLLLVGCFSSNGPVFSEDRGQCPFATPTLYEETEDPNRFTFETEGHYCKVTGPDGDVTLALFIPIGRERWIVQGDEASPTYMIMRQRRSADAVSAALSGLFCVTSPSPWHHVRRRASLLHGDGSAPDRDALSLGSRPHDGCVSARTRRALVYE